MKSKITQSIYEKKFILFNFDYMILIGLTILTCSAIWYLGKTDTDEEYKHVAQIRKSNIHDR